MLGLSFEDAQAVAAEAAGDEICSAANDNADGQVVISGSKAAVERAAELGRAEEVDAVAHGIADQRGADGQRQRRDDNHLDTAFLAKCLH